MDEIELEVFRADTRASRGITAADIADAATAYDPANHPAAICLGHPKSDTPAFGRIKALRAEGSSLFATIPVKPELVDGIKKETLLNRSMAFFGRNHEANPVPGKLYPRHLGFLGASAPGIPGMKPLAKALAFNADAGDDGEIEITGDPAEAVVFEPAPTPVFSVSDEEPTVDPKPANEPTNDQLKAEREKLDADRLAFQAEQKSARESANAAIVDGLVSSGRLLPKDADRAKLIFNALDHEPLEFEAGKDKRSPASELAALLGSGVKLVPVGEGRQSPAEQFTAGADIKDDPKAIEREAKKLQAAEPGLTFEAAVERVTGQQED